MNESEKRSTRKWLVFWTIVFIVLFLPALAEVTTGVHNNSFRMSNLPDVVGAVSVFAICLSMPVSIIMMWVRFAKKNYEKALLTCTIPSFTLMGFYFVVSILRAALS